MAKDKKTIEELVEKLKELNYELTLQDSLTEFLGLKYERNQVEGTFTLTQKGLISKILEATGMEDCNPNQTPASIQALGSDPDGEPMNEKWNYRAIIGMLLYLVTNTRPDLAYAVSQAARFSANPKKSHAAAVKQIIRYLQGTHDKGIIFKPDGSLALKAYVDADFAGLYKRENARDPTAVKSRYGYVIKLGNCPLLWRTKLISEICLSTLEAEYVGLSKCMRVVIPTYELVKEISSTLLNLTTGPTPTISATVFEDNNGALNLATKQQITDRTKHLLIKWHFFWENVQPQGPIAVERINTEDQDADYETKGLPAVPFKANRKRVQGW